MKKLILLLLASLTLGVSAFGQVVGPVSLTGVQCAQISTFDQTATVGIFISGSWSGTIQPQGAIQGQSAFNVQVSPAASPAAQATITANGGFVSAVAGLSVFQVCGNSITGTAVVFLNGSQAQLGSGAGGGGGGSCAEGTCIRNTPTGDQTIAGAFQLINKGTDQTGPLLSTFDSHITGVAFDPATGNVRITGQSLGTGTSNAGVQGIAQNPATSGVSESLGVFGLASMTDTLGTGTGGPFGGFFQSFLTSTVNTPLIARGIGTQTTLSPAVGTTMSGPQYGQQSAIGNVGLGTVSKMNAFFAELDNLGGGAVTLGNAYDAGSLVGGATRTAVYHADDQGSGANNYGILLEGVTHNDLGGGVTKVGGLLNSGLNASVPVFTDASKNLISGTQTGTGTKVVVDTSPTLVTPNIGVATATSVNGFTPGGVLFASVGNTDTVACPNNTTGNFATTYTIPANYLVANKILRLTVSFAITSSASPPNVGYRMTIGGTTVFTGTAVVPTINMTGSPVTAQFYIQGSAAAAASAAVYTAVTPGFQISGTAYGPWVAVGVGVNNQPVNLATNGTMVIQPQLFCSTNTAGNSLKLQQMIVEALN